ncbi:MAG: sigma-54 dependent transcriptional regulator [Bacteroidales bacterium]|jgi:transcriptional regulator with PAS, ATPase and Fis domain|nr:sigma-54 dependent transcriptional regulator [Bacteroidales bacterium]
MAVGIDIIKQRLGIITRNPEMNRAIETAIRVAPTDLSVLITGESGVGKEFFPKIIHQESPRKHGQYIAINCGAIPEGTIDSELFGHEKGSFTDAKEARKGYFEVANGGSLFLDEVAELPFGTQVRLLRVLETGEFIKVGSSKPQKTDVRVVAATNVDIPNAILKGSFREDLYYRLNTIHIDIPPLRKRKEDIELLFLKFSTDISEKYRMPAIELDAAAKNLLFNYEWKGNVRQLKNVTEQISIIEKNRLISADILKNYLPENHSSVPMLFTPKNDGISERELLYSVLFDMKKDITELKKALTLLTGNKKIPVSQDVIEIIPNLNDIVNSRKSVKNYNNTVNDEIENADVIDSLSSEAKKAIDLSLENNEKDLIIKALEKHNGKRNLAAQELGISERTLYRKIFQYEIDT